MKSNTASQIRIDWSLLLAAAVVICGWFRMTTMVTDLGLMQLHFRFYNALTLIRNPVSILAGVRGGRSGFEAFLFGTLCILAVLAALTPLVSRRKVAWAGCAAPLVLMVFCGAILYHDSTQDFIVDSGSLGQSGSQLIHFANQLANEISGAIGHQVSIGAGGYVSFLASAFLAVKGWLGYLKARAPDAGRRIPDTAAAGGISSDAAGGTDTGRSTLPDESPFPGSS